MQIWDGMEPMGNTWKGCALLTETLAAVSTGTNLTLVFTSDYSVTMGGFSLNYYQSQTCKSVSSFFK